MGNRWFELQKSSISETLHFLKIKINQKANLTILPKTKNQFKLIPGLVLDVFHLRKGFFNLKNQNGFWILEANYCAWGGAWF